MIDDSETLGDLSIEAQGRVYEKYLTDKSLRVAILGPNLSNIEEIGTRKRYEIRDALEDDGHEPFFPECFIDVNDSTSLWIRIEQQLLADPQVDLVIIFHTPEAFGVLTEISNFIDVYEIYSKAAILFPSQFYQPYENLPANTVQGYYVKKIYTEDELRECHVVTECRKWAGDRLNGNWPQLPAHQF